MTYLLKGLLMSRSETLFIEIANSESSKRTHSSRNDTEITEVFSVSYSKMQ